MNTRRMGRGRCSSARGSNDPGCYAATIGSRKFRISSVDQPYGICEIGHQGLEHDEESWLVYNRARMLQPIVGTWTQRDPRGYVDGMSLFVYLRAAPNVYIDPLGLAAAPCTPEHEREIRDEFLRQW